MHFNSLRIFCTFALEFTYLQQVYTAGVMSLGFVEFLHLGLPVEPDINTSLTISVCMSNMLSRECSYGETSVVVSIQGDYIKFGRTIGNTSNPITFKFKSWTNPSRLTIKVCNISCNVNQNDSVLEMYSEDLENDPEQNGVQKGKHIVLMGKFSRFSVELDSRCDVGYYGDCTRYCTDHPYRYKCDCTGHKICEAGWEGIECDKNIDDCIRVHCQNNATCRDGFNAFYCICNKGFTGNYCEKTVSTEIKQNTRNTTVVPKFLSTSNSEQKTSKTTSNQTPLTPVKNPNHTTTTSEKTPDQTITTSEKTLDPTATSSEKTLDQTATSSEKTLDPTATSSEKTLDQTTNTMQKLILRTTDINLSTKNTNGNLFKNTTPSNTSLNINLKSLRRLGNKQDEDNGLPISSGGVIGISVSIVALVLVSVIVVKLVRWCRMKDTFTVNDGSSISSNSDDFAVFDNQAAQSEWMYYRNM